MSVVVLGRYRIERAVEGGVTGSVYRGRDTETDEPVAIKEVRRDQAWSAAPGPLCEVALQAAHRVHTPGIAQLRRIEEDEGRLLIVSEWVDCEGLREIVQWTEGRMAPPAAVAYVVRVLDLLATAHQHGLLHGDLKPDNVVVPRGGALERAAILDFGVGALLGDSGVGRMGDGLVPNLAYRAPEQLRDPADIRVQTDVYAIGAILYELLTGAPPHGTAPSEQVIRGHLEGSFASLADAGPGLPDGLVQLVRQALSLNSDERPESAAVFRDALAEYEPPAAARRRAEEGERLQARTRFHEETTDQHAALNEAATATAVPALSEEPAPNPRSRLPLLIAAGLGLAAVAVAVWYLLS